jgi:hypothetical protein
VAQLVEQSVRNTDGRISAKRLLPLAKKDGYTGSARNFRRAVAEAKVGWKKERRTYRPWVPVVTFRIMCRSISGISGWD